MAMAKLKIMAISGRRKRRNIRKKMLFMCDYRPLKPGISS